MYRRPSITGGSVRNYQIIRDTLANLFVSLMYGSNQIPDFLIDRTGTQYKLIGKQDIIDILRAKKALLLFRFRVILTIILIWMEFMMIQLFVNYW